MMIPEIQTNGASATVMIRGDLVASSIEALRDKLKKILADGASAIVFDLAECQIVDSTGLGLLIATHNSMVKCGGTLSVVRASDDLNSLFRSMRMDQHFSITRA